MRIGLVSCEYPPQQGLGGVGTYMFRLAGALGAAGHNVHVIAGPSDRAPVTQANVTLHRVDVPDGLPHPILRWIGGRHVAKLMRWSHPVVWHWLKWDFASWHALREVDAAWPLDLVEAPEHAANGWMAGRIHRWPIVLRFHCPWELFVRINGLPVNPMNWLLSHLERRTIARYPDAITVPSRAMLEEVERSWRLRCQPTVIPNFMDVSPTLAPLPDDAGPQRIVCHGRIEPLKGQDTLVQAFALIAHKHPRAELWLIGPDRWAPHRRFADLVPQLVSDPAVRQRIHMPGLVPLQQIQEQLRSARVCVAASVGFESFSYSTLEAMSAGRPTIVSRTGALPELVEHETTGLTVPPSDASELAVALDRLLCDRSFSEACGRSAHQKAADCYDTRRVLPKIIRAYEQAAESYHGAAHPVLEMPPSEAAA